VGTHPPPKYVKCKIKKAKFDSVLFHFVGVRFTFFTKSTPPLHFLPTDLFRASNGEEGGRSKKRAMLRRAAL